jgi:hypothetical protein
MNNKNDGVDGGADVTPIRPGPGGPRKRANAKTVVTVDDLTKDDEISNLTAIKRRLSEMLARPDLLERDLAALNKDYRKVIVELQEAQLRVKSATLGQRNGLKAVRSFDDAIGG